MEDILHKMLWKAAKAISSISNACALNAKESLGILSFL